MANYPKLGACSSTDYFWDHTCFKLKALYECKAINENKAPMIRSKINREDMYCKEYAVCINLINRYDNKTSKVAIPYYRVPRYSYDTREVRKAYKKLMCQKSDLMDAMKYVFSDLRIKEFKYEDEPGSNHYVVEKINSENE